MRANYSSRHSGPSSLQGERDFSQANANNSDDMSADDSEVLVRRTTPTRLPNGYTDYGSERREEELCDPYAHVFSTMFAKEPPFPIKLHRILCSKKYEDIIRWLPHGRSWIVLDSKAFEEEVIPHFFHHGRYSSFMRQVNGWGFKRISSGPDTRSYYHEVSSL